ncbi:MAG: ElaA protein [Chlamydiales bacterium]|jgi:ElaA protein
MNLRWQWGSLQSLKPNEQYSMHQLRQEVFVVEQSCPYLDADGADFDAFHLLGWKDLDDEIHLATYLRVILSQDKKEVILGRIATSSKVRGYGCGRQIMEKAIENIEAQYGKITIKMSAQVYAASFYNKFGFKVMGKEYLEDNIPHIMMIRDHTHSDD